MSGWYDEKPYAGKYTLTRPWMEDVVGPSKEVLDERERCAKIAEDHPDSDADTREGIAKKIRSGK